MVEFCQVTNRVTFEAYRSPSGNVLAVKGGCQSRPIIVIECSFEGGKMVMSSRLSLHADRVTFLEGRSFILGGGGGYCFWLI